MPITSTGGSAQVTIYRLSDDAQVYALNANAGETKEEDLTLAAGSYWIKTLKNTASTGNGCSVTFHEWVPHAISGNQLVGGLRIKSMTNKDSLTGQATVTNYTYRVSQNPSGHSTGILYSRPTYLQIIRNNVFKLVWGATGNCSMAGCASCDGSTELLWYKSPGSLRPMATTQNSHIGYNDVYVSQAGNGFAWFRYYGSNYWDTRLTDVCVRYVAQPTSCTTAIPNYPESPLPYEPMRGELKYQGFFNQEGELVKSFWHYPGFLENQLTTPGHMTANVGNLQTFTSYSLVSYRKYRDSVEETTYVPTMMQMIPSESALTATVTKSTYYNSIFHYSPDRKVTLTPSGDVLETRVQYALDFVAPSCLPSIDSTEYFMGLIHSDSTSLLTDVSTCSPQSGIGYSNCRYGTFQKYRRYIALDRQQMIAYRRRTYSDSARSACIGSLKSGANNVLKPIMQLQEEFQNPPIEVAHYKNGKTLGADFTLYKYAIQPSNHVYPGYQQSMRLRMPENAGYYDLAATSNNDIIRDSRYRDEMWMVHKDGKIADLHTKSGVTLTYVYDYDHTMPIAEIVGAADSVVACTSFEADGTGNWTIASSARLDTQSITGKQSYNLAAGNISRSGLIDSMKYYLSYWTKSSSPLTITGTQGTPQEGQTIHGWRCFLHTISGVSAVTLTGAAIIDELRLYPAMLLDTKKSQNFIKPGLTAAQLYEASVIHEIGHNLGGVHGDPGTIMIDSDAQEQLDGSWLFKLSEITNDGVRAIMGRMDMPYRTQGSPYLSDEEVEKVKKADKVGSNGKLKKLQTIDRPEN